MPSFLLGDDYASSSSSDEKASPRPSQDTQSTSTLVKSTLAHALPSADELFANDTSGVLTTSSETTASSATHKRRNEQNIHKPFKLAKLESGKAAHKAIMKPFAPPQLRRPNVSTEDRSSWTTAKTLQLQRRMNDAKVGEK